MYSHWTKTLILILLGVSLILFACSKNSPGPVPVPDQGLRYNEVSFKQTHNSYDREYDWVSSLDFDPTKPYYGGVSGLEFDLLPDYNIFEGFKWGWDVGHWDPGGLDNGGPFSNFLGRLLSWSNANPDHRVITVTLELKNVDGTPDEAPGTQPAFPLWYRQELPDKLDKYIRDRIGEDRIYKPGDLMAGYSNLVAAAQAKGWPTLEELRGKFIFVVQGQRDTSVVEKGPTQYYSVSPAERLCFESFVGSQPDPHHGNMVFWRMDTHDFDGSWRKKALWAADQPGFITRGYPQADWNMEGVYDRPERWTCAVTACVNEIATDHTRSNWATVGQQPFWPFPRVYRSCDSVKVAGIKPSGDFGAIEFRGELYVVYDLNNEPRYIKCRGEGNFEGPFVIPGGKSSGRPALAVFENKLWVISRDEQGRNIHYRTFDGTSWSDRTLIGVARDDPSAAIFNGELCLIYYGVAFGSGGSIIISDVIRHWTGSEWSEPVRISAGHGANAVCVKDGVLRIFFSNQYGSERENHLCMTSYDGTTESVTFLTDIVGANPYVDVQPSAVLVNDQIHVIYLGGFEYYPQGLVRYGLYYNVINQQGEISGVRRLTVGNVAWVSSEHPAVGVMYNSKLYVFFKSFYMVDEGELRFLRSTVE